ncbi:MAG: hypothetical protein JWQ34_185 [Mucilaginibacter sp.]|uniref:hypothetical protein n=1 Tax=Mucilaginibacter sp. TaxID=1882438 RepID=UPI002604DA35|nr:hypothetical protein [Mucilaginibacter sp.]MDB5001960.1 hypothetical protein [Mucilaginibacter sp.]
MKPAYIVTLLLCCSLVSNAQKLIVIDVEKLERPDNRLPVWSYHDILKNLIRMDHHAYGFRTPELQAKHDPQFNIVAKSNIADSLVSYGYHPLRVCIMLTQAIGRLHYRPI